MNRFHAFLLSVLVVVSGAVPYSGLLHAQELPPGMPKISGEIRARQIEKAEAAAMSGPAQADALRAMGLAGQALDAEECALYVDAPLDDVAKADLAAAGIVVHDVYVPPVPGKHPHGYYLATVPYASLPRVDSSTRIVRLESVEFQHYPLNDLAGDFTRVGDVHAGAGVTARTGSGIKIAVADSGIDLTHADFPTPVEQFDVTDGVGISNWGTNVANTVSDHGTHVTGSVLGRGTLSGGQYVGSAPAADLYFYKIGDDVTAGASEADEIEAIDRALAVGCDIFTMSYGGVGVFQDGSDAASQAIDAAVAAGMTCFVAAGNDQARGWHDSVTAPLNSTTSSFGFTVDNTAGMSTLNSPLSIRVIWIDGAPGDSNIALSCTNLGAGESLTLAFNSFSARGTEGQRYVLTPNVAAGASKSYAFRLANSAASGTAPLVHLFQVSGLNQATFDSPDPAYTIATPALADSAIAVGAWTQRKSWTNYQGSGFQFSAFTVNTLAPFSSLGPRVDGVMKPDIVAPGAATISARDSVGSLAAVDAFIIDNDGLNRVKI